MRDALRMISAIAATLMVASTAALASAAGEPPRMAATTGSGGGLLGPYTPPACVAGVPFADVTCTTPYDAWIEQFARDGITGGCGGGDYCPGTAVTRDQMAVFVERAMRGTANWPAHTQFVWAVKAADGSPDSVGSGTALLNAVAAIPTSGNDAPSATNHWLVKVGPGWFDLGASALSLPSYVDLEGSGVDTTRVDSTVNDAGTIVANGWNSVRGLTINDLGTGLYTYAVYGASGQLTLRSVSIRAVNGTSFNVGIFLDNDALDMADSLVYTVGAEDLGIFTYGTPNLAVIARSVINSQFFEIDNNAGYGVDLAYNGLFNSVLHNVSPGTFLCIGNYDQSYTVVTCP